MDARPVGTALRLHDAQLQTGFCRHRNGPPDRRAENDAVLGLDSEMFEFHIARAESEAQVREDPDRASAMESEDIALCEGRRERPNDVSSAV